MKTTTVTKNVLTRDWNDLEPKLLVFLSTGVTASGLILIAGYLGISLTAPEASLGVVLISSIAAYLKKSSTTLPAPVAAPKPVVAAPVKVAPATTTAPPVAVVTPPTGTLAQQVTALATPPVPPTAP